MARIDLQGLRHSYLPNPSEDGDYALKQVDLVWDDGGAYALLHLINFAEPFGLSMIEAMACGTPVIAHPLGSIPEIIKHQQTGFIVDSLDEAVAAVQALAEADLPGKPQMWIVTRGAQRVAEDAGVTDPWQASLWGLAQVINA